MKLRAELVTEIRGKIEANGGAERGGRTSWDHPTTGLRYAPWKTLEVLPELTR